MIVCLAPNPSVDKLFEVPRLRPGAIHRPLRLVSVPGGKGLNVARAAATLGAEVLAVPLLAGHAGRWVAEALASESLRAVPAWAAGGETRHSLSVADVESGGLTEFYESGTGIREADWESFETTVRDAVAGAAWVTLSGSLPPGAPTDGHGRLVRLVHEAGARAALDARGPALATGLAASPALVKVNRFEAAEVLGRAIRTERDAFEGAAELARRSGSGAGAVAVAVTMGRDGCVLVAADRHWRGTVDAAGRYPVGSGDAFLAGAVVSLERGSDWRDALRLALGTAAANAEEPGAGRLRRERATELAERARVVEVGPPAG